MGGVLGAIRGQLKDLRVLEDLPAALRSRVMMIFLTVSEDHIIRHGATLFTEDEQSDEAGYVLLEGSVSVRKQDGESVTCSGPELLGEMQMLNPRHTRTATVVAATDVKVLKFNWRSFFQVAEDIFDADELAALREGLADLAWKHFTG
jgi:CRP-like cAMP-binding protein